jgi:chaperonin GroEL
MSKIIYYGADAREKIASGAKKLSKAVSVTMGPHGRNVLIGKFVGAPTITKDGVSVAREVVLLDTAEELGCRIIKEVAGRTADVAGDGTTTATVLAESILSGGIENMSEGENPIFFRDGVILASKMIKEYINSLAIDISSYEQVRNIATISANSDIELGKTIADAFEMVDRVGLVSAEAHAGSEHRVKFTDGIEIKAGYSTPALLKKGESSINLEKASILICDRDITHAQDFIRVLEDLHKSNKPLVIIAKSIKLEALELIALNRANGRLNAVTVEYPSFGRMTNEWLNDLALLCGTKVFSEDLGLPLSSATIHDLGFADRVSLTRHSTTILGGKKSEGLIQERIAFYMEALNNLIPDSERRDLKERISFLNNKAALIGVAYSTEAELREKGDRVDDAICATKAAIESGILPGGGVALLRASSSIDWSLVPKKYEKGARVLAEACKMPFKQILLNGYKSSDEILEIQRKILLNDDLWTGYNLSEDELGNMLDMGVIDPKKVTLTALDNAVSITLLLLNTEAILSEDLITPSGWQPPAGWRPPSSGNLNHSH